MTTVESIEVRADDIKIFALEMHEQIKSLKADRRASSDAIESLTRDYYAAKAEVTRLTSQVDFVGAENIRLKTELADMRESLEISHGNFAGAVDDFLKLKAELAEARTR